MDDKLNKADMAKRYIAKLAKMVTERQNYDSWNQEVADMTLPKRDFTTTRTPNSRRTARIYDSTGVYATTMLASGLHGNLTPPTGKWFYFAPPKDIDDAGREWLQLVSDDLLLTFASPSSLFASQSFECYLDLVAFGQAVMIPMVMDGRIVYRSRPLNACWVKENDSGIIDRLYYKASMCAEEIVQIFGAENVHERVNEAVSKDTDEKFDILHVVEPREDHYGPGAVAEAKPFKSCYIDINNSHIMRESGYDSFPYLVPRFSKRSGETYGYGPGHDALPEVKTANEFAEVMFRAAAKNVDPPVLSPIEGLVLPMRLDPNGINYYDPTVGEPKFWSSTFNPNYLASLLADKQELIKRMYYIDWMNMPDRNGMTATEVIQRSQESMRMMGPSLARLEAEFLTPLISRTIELKISNGMLPQPPESLQGRDVTIEYMSPLAQAQRTANANQVMSGLSVAMQLAQFDPSVVQNIDGNQIFRDQVQTNFGWPSDYLLTKDEVAQAQQAQAEAQQSAMMAQQAETYSKAMKNGAQAAETLQ